MNAIRNDDVRVVALVDDLIFATAIQSTARSHGRSIAIVKSAAAMETVVARGALNLLIVDLNSAGDGAFSAIAAARQLSPAPRIVAFVSHVHRELAERAVAAGADEVMPRSRFVRQLPNLLTREMG